MGGRGDDEGDLLAEQLAFYRADAASFDEWLGTRLDETNDDPGAVIYRAGRSTAAALFARRAPLGRVLEIAAGTGRLAPLYLPHAAHATLLDASPESLAIAARHTDGWPQVELVEADVYGWAEPGPPYDTVVFSAWLHHVPATRFQEFWRRVDSLLAGGGRVVFDFQDARDGVPGEPVVPDEPAEDYGFYAPVDGVSIRDHFGRRWRVVHHLWDPDELAGRLSALGWTMSVVGPGLFGNVRWAEARRS